MAKSKCDAQCVVPDANNNRGDNVEHAASLQVVKACILGLSADILTVPGVSPKALLSLRKHAKKYPNDLTVPHILATVNKRVFLVADAVRSYVDDCC